MKDNMELFKQFQDNPSFKKWLSDMVFNLTYSPDGKPNALPGTKQKSESPYETHSEPPLMVAENKTVYESKKGNKE